MTVSPPMVTLWCWSAPSDISVAAIGSRSLRTGHS